VEKDARCVQEKTAIKVCGMAQVQICEGDLLDQQVEVIVNSWNRNIFPWWLLLPKGVSGAIKRRAGIAPFRELARMGLIPLGGAVVTTAGSLSFKAISPRPRTNAPIAFLKELAHQTGGNFLGR
jgi:O-acetyl-ADP-ribose deacetylase (regulator of RNase III)